MSEPKRYNVEELNCCFDAEMVEHPTGEYVEYHDYALLKAEVERLKNNCDYLDKMLDDELDKSAMLCGQVMRLLNTGDAMQKRLVFLHDRWDVSEICEESEAWDAAKESKPNE